MKNNLITSLFFLLFISGFSQNFLYDYSGTQNLSIKKEKLNTARFLNDITTKYWLKLALPYEAHIELYKRREEDLLQGYYIKPQEYNYTRFLDYVSVEISTTSNGKISSFKSVNDKLTVEQRKSVANADLGTTINIKIQFRYIYSNYDKLVTTFKIMEGQLAVAVVPDTGAEYPGGPKVFSEYLKKNMVTKFYGAHAYDEFRNAVLNFTINEQGQVVDAKLSKSAVNPTLDKILVAAIYKMPKWSPAKNAKGIKVKQEFSIALGGISDGC